MNRNNNARDNNGKNNGKYCVVVPRDLMANGKRSQLQPNLTERVLVDIPLPKEAKELIEKYSILGKTFSNALSEKLRNIDKKLMPDIYQHYEELFNVIINVAGDFEGNEKENYLRISGLMFANMQNDLPPAIDAFKILGDWMKINEFAANDFVKIVVKANNSETLAGICKYNQPPQ